MSIHQIHQQTLKESQYRKAMIKELKQQIKELEEKNSVQPGIQNKIEKLKDDLFYWENPWMDR